MFGKAVKVDGKGALRAKEGCIEANAHGTVRFGIGESVEGLGGGSVYNGGVRGWGFLVLLIFVFLLRRGRLRLIFVLVTRSEGEFPYSIQHENQYLVNGFAVLAPIENFPGVCVGLVLLDGGGIFVE